MYAYDNEWYYNTPTPKKVNPLIKLTYLFLCLSSTSSFVIANGDEGLSMKNDANNATDIDIGQTYSKPKQKHWLTRRFFILSWIRDYDREKAVSDLIAGITLGMTIIPQSIAYAALAGLSSEYGLYSAFIGKFSPNERVVEEPRL